MKKIIILASYLTIITVLGISHSIWASTDIINKNKKGVVSIRARGAIAAYNSTGSWSGTGFVVNKEKGIILTNNHVIGTATTSTFEVTFFNGRELEATILYMDPLLDFGFLKVDPQKLPEEVLALELKQEEVLLNQDVLMIGKNEGQNFSINVGRITSIYESIGHFPNQSYRISLNAQGGASGSPVITQEGTVVALTHSSNLSSSAFALPIAYVMDALKPLLNNKKPIRRFTGALVVYHSLDRTSKFNHFPRKLIDKFMKKYPEALNKAIMVDRIFKDTPAEGSLHLGDVIWAVNGKEVGPNIYDYDKLLNESEEITFTVYRGEEKKEIKVKTYDLAKAVIHRMVEFGGATFYEADHFTRLVTGASYGTVFITNIKPGSSFYDRFPPISGTDKVFINTIKLNGHEVKNLDELIKLIPSLIKKEDFYAVYNNYAFYSGHSNTPIFSTHYSLEEISYNELDGKAHLFEFNNKTGKWVASEINEK